MTSTVAPLVMAASAWVCIVWVLPCAFCTWNWPEDRPAAWNACVRYGASKLTYRADDCVSGRSTATLPLPFLARGFSVAMAEKSLVNDAGVSDARGTVARAREVDPPIVSATVSAVTTRIALEVFTAVFMGTPGRASLGVARRWPRCEVRGSAFVVCKARCAHLAPDTNVPRHRARVGGWSVTGRRSGG